MAFKPEAMGIAARSANTRFSNQDELLDSSLGELMSAPGQDFIGDEELLSCLVSLSKKLQRLQYQEAC